MSKSVSWQRSGKISFAKTLNTARFYKDPKYVQKALVQQLGR